MTGDNQIYPGLKINTAVALVHGLRTAGKPVRDVYRGQGGGYWISLDGWEVDAAAVEEAAARGLIVLTYPGKSASSRPPALSAKSGNGGPRPFRLVQRFARDRPSVG
jgi:hypothetical protein